MKLTKLTAFAPAAAMALIAGCNGAEEDTAPADTAEVEAPAPVATGTDDPGVDEVAAKEEPKAFSTDMTCTNPVKFGDTAKSLMDRFGDDATIKTLIGREGMEISGIVLWAKDPKKMVEVGFDDEARTKISFAQVGEGSIWKVASLSIGDTLEKAAKVNGAPIKFMGFEWDFAGAVSDMSKGKLDTLDGGCNVQMSLGYDYENYKMPEAMMGDVELSSDQGPVDAKELVIADMGVGFPIED